MFSIFKPHFRRSYNSCIRINVKPVVNEHPTLLLHISPSIGTVSAEYKVPETSNCMLTLAHGAGAGLNHPFMVTQAKSLSENGIATLRFNFPFIEGKRGDLILPLLRTKRLKQPLPMRRNCFLTWRFLPLASPLAEG